MFQDGIGGQREVVALGEVPEIALECARERPEVVRGDLEAAAVTAEIDGRGGCLGLPAAKQPGRDAADGLDGSAQDPVRRALRDLDAERGGDAHEIRGIGSERKP